MTVFLTNSEAVSQLCPLYCVSHTVLLNSLTVSFCPLSHLCFIIWEFQQEPTGQQEMVQLHSFVWSSVVALSGYILKFNRSLQFSVCITAFFALIYLISLTIVSELDDIYISRHEQTCMHMSLHQQQIAEQEYWQNTLGGEKLTNSVSTELYWCRI